MGHFKVLAGTLRVSQTVQYLVFVVEAWGEATGSAITFPGRTESCVSSSVTTVVTLWCRVTTVVTLWYFRYFV